MLVRTKLKSDVNKEIYDTIIRAYFQYIKNEGLSLTSGYDISELLRYSLCRSLNLQSQGATAKVRQYAIGVSNILNPVVKDLGLMEKTEEYRQGVLEACVHCLEMARRNVNV